MSVLEVRGVRKRFGSIVAVDGVSFSAEAGQIVGLLGPNGAGKTTTISMLTGLVKPDGGEICIAGSSLKADDDPVKRRIGLVPQDLALYDELSAEENLHLLGSLYSLSGAALNKAICENLELVGLADRRRDRVEQYSGGMKRRLNLAAALLHNPDILLLDEPTVGVDPQSRNAIFDNLELLRGCGKALVYTTHYMEEVERLCDRIVVMDHGKVIADDTRQGLYGMVGGHDVLEVEVDGGGPFGGLAQLPGVDWFEHRERTIRVGLNNLDRSESVLVFIAQQGGRVGFLRSERPSLEAVFLHLTGRSLRDQ